MRTSSEHEWSLRLLGAWRLLSNGQPAHVSSRQQRLLTALALTGARSRVAVAGLLWPAHTDAHAAGNLRATLWHISHELPGVLADTDGLLSISPQVDVDLWNLRTSVKDLSAGTLPPSADLVEQLKDAELLPGWYEDWVLFEQEHVQRLRLSALDRLASELLDRGDLELAAAAATSAVGIEPLRESSHRLLIESLLAAGNVAAAIRDFNTYQANLQAECSATPSKALVDLVAAARTDGTDGAPANGLRSGVLQRSLNQP